MNYVRRHSKVLIILLLIVTLYLTIRLPNLTLQPIFADEAIYIRWAQVMRAEPTLRFLPLSDGKTPLFMWSVMPALKTFKNPLWAGRIVSVASGLVTMLGVGFLGWYFFNPQVCLWGMLLYTITPYMVFFDRMALVDSMLSAFTIWSLNLGLILARFNRLDLSMFLGYFLGFGLLTKTPAFLNILMLPTTLLSAKFRIRLVPLWVLAIGIALIMYNLLRLGPNFQQLALRNADYVFSPIDLVTRPWDPFLPHFYDLLDWFPKLLTWPILFLVILGTYLLIFQRNKVLCVILIWALVPILTQMIFLKTFTARYLLFSIPPLIIIAGFALTQLTGKLKIPYLLPTLLALAVILPQPLHFDYQLLTTPHDAPLPKDERRGYFEDWTAGYGFPEIAKFLLEVKKQDSVVVGTEGYFGTLPDGLQIYLDKSGIPVVRGHATISAELRQAAKENQTFFVANKNRLPQNLKGVEKIKEYPKAKPKEGLQDAIVLFRVFP